MSAVRLEGLRKRQELAAAARSSLYLRLARAFAFPSPELIEDIARGRFLAALRAEAAALPFELPIDRETEAALSQPGLTHDGLQQEYIRLFEVGAGGPPCPLYEGLQRKGRMKLMEELVRFYEHFGLHSQPGDPPDHLSTELEFMHYLAFKEAAALSRGGPTSAFVLAQRDFLARHLCLWLPRLRSRLESLDPPPIYRALAALAEALAGLDRKGLAARGAKPDADIGPLPD